MLQLLPEVCRLLQFVKCQVFIRYSIRVHAVVLDINLKEYDSRLPGGRCWP